MSEQLFEILTLFLLGSDIVLTELYYDACVVIFPQDDIVESVGWLEARGKYQGKRVGYGLYQNSTQRGRDRRRNWMMVNEDN